MKITSFIRGGLVAAVILATVCAQARVIEYSMATAPGANTTSATPPEGWTYHSICPSTSKGDTAYAYLNAVGDYMCVDDIGESITSVLVSYKVSTSTPSRKLQLIPMSGSDDLSEGISFNYAVNTDTAQIFDLSGVNGCTRVKINLGGGGNSGNWTIYSVSITTSSVAGGVPPNLTSIANSSVYYGSSSTNILSFAQTEGDPILSSNIVVKADTPAPIGSHSFDGQKMVFVPAPADVGSTFTFVASVEDKDGISECEFTVEVLAVSPALEDATINDFTSSSFTARIKTLSPDATSYTLSYKGATDDAWTSVTGLSANDFPYTLSNLKNEYYSCKIKALYGSAESEESNEVVFQLSAFDARTPAVPILEGRYEQDFNSLTQTKSLWFDGHTLPGWYAVYNKKKYSYNGRIFNNYEGGTDEGDNLGVIFSGRVDKNDLSNRAIGARAKTKDDMLAYGVVFTNESSRSVTGITVKFTGLQFRRQNAIATNEFYYAKSGTFFNLSSNVEWTKNDTLSFANIETGSGYAPASPYTTGKCADITFVGNGIVKPGETFAIKWQHAAGGNCPSFGIDNLEVTWKFAKQKRLAVVIF